MGREGAWERKAVGEGKENACAGTHSGIFSSSFGFITREALPDFQDCTVGE